MINVKLTETQVIEIMRNDTMNITQLAAHYNVHRETIRNIFIGKCWPHLSHHMLGVDRDKLKCRKLNEQQVIEILQNDTDSAAALAERYGVHQDTIRSIHTGKLWKHLYHHINPNKRKDWQRRKLTEDVVRSIKNFEVDDFDALAKQYGVTVKYLKQFRNPRFLEGWKYIPVKGYEDPKNIPPKYQYKLTPEMVEKIYRNRTATDAVLARIYKISKTSVNNVRTGKRWTHITSKIQLDC